MKKDRKYRIFFEKKLIAFGLASEDQVKAWSKRGYNILSAI